MHTHGALSVWFFIGVLLTVYGVLILGSGIVEYNSPPPNVVLSNLHAPVWWGALLLIVGLVYLIRSYPRKQR